MGITAVGNDLDELIVLDLDTEWYLPCEHGAHAKKPKWHSDDSGSFLVYIMCECHPPEKIIFCGRWVEAFSSGAIDNLGCSSCGKIDAPWDCYKVIERLT